MTDREDISFIHPIVAKFKYCSNTVDTEHPKMYKHLFTFHNAESVDKLLITDSDIDLLHSVCKKVEMQKTWTQIHLSAVCTFTSKWKHVAVFFMLC